MTVKIHCGPLPSRGAVDKHLIPAGLERTVVIDLSGLESHSATSLPPLTRDLTTVASYVLLADGAVSRGSRDDPLATRWRRSIRLSIPVEEPDRWASSSVELKRLLDYVTDDDWQFDFRSGSFGDQLKLGLLEPLDPEPTCVLLFSGGLDSLAGALCLRSDNERPILATHRTTPSGTAAARMLVERVRSRDPEWRFPNPTLITMRAPGAGDAAEYSQRSRGFLYLCLGTAVALQNSVSRVVVAENGVTSLNLAQSSQSPGAMRSRTTHPRAIAFFRDLTMSLGADVTIETPFANHTKADVIEKALELAPEELVHTAVSCSHSMYRSSATPHCGTCSQCIDRRFAGLAAGWADDVEASLHTVDIFSDPLPEGEPVAYAEQYVRFAVEMSAVSPDVLARKRPEVWDALVTEDAGEELVRIGELIGRHAGQTLNAWTKVQHRYQVDFLKGELDPMSLLPRIGKLEHLVEPWQKLARRLMERIEPALRRAFVSKDPGSEAEVQIAFDVAQTAARADLAKEFPTVSYGVVGTRPDFSRDTDLFVEVKFIKDATTRRRVVDEMLADIPKYRHAGARILFVVWDNCGCIPDQREFATLVRGSSADVEIRVVRR